MEACTEKSFVIDGNRGENMTKTAIEKQLKSATGGKILLCMSEIARCLGMGKDHTRSLLAGLDYLPSGREKRYLISDVAERIAERKRV